MKPARLPALGVALAAGVAGLGFAPVFGVRALVWPIMAVVVPVILIDQWALGRPRWTWWRTSMELLFGALIGLTVLSWPDWDFMPALTGAAHGWLSTLESTIPAQPDPELLAFVPALVLLAAVVGLEWLRRDLPRLLSLGPGLGVLVLSQVFQSLDPLSALGLALGYAALAAIALAGGRQGRWALSSAAMIAAAAAVVALLMGTMDPLGRTAYTLRDNIELPSVLSGSTSPLAQMGGRLAHPDRIVFTASTSAPVDRWPLVVMDTFDGSVWTSHGRYRPLSTSLDSDPAMGRTTEQTASIRMGADADVLWLPSQLRTESVSGLRVNVDPDNGTLLLPDGPPLVDMTYLLTWQMAEPSLGGLRDANVADSELGAARIGQTPDGVAEATRAAVGEGRAPTFVLALEIERYLRENYRLVTGVDAPTGSGSEQIQEFLQDTRRGTTEQFAAAYVLMARSANLPARLVVGYRQPAKEPSGTFVVRNGDAIAWPEIAVEGVGWVPLDPATGALTAEGGISPIGRAKEAASAYLPAQPLHPEGQLKGIAQRGGWWVVPTVVGGVVLAALLGWLIGVPVAKSLRCRRRRRASGLHAVVGAWLETRDRLSDHGVPVRSSMTVREMREPAVAVIDGVSDRIDNLAKCVDKAVWFPGPPTPTDVDDAWTAADEIGRALAGRPLRERLPAALRLGSLRSPRRVGVVEEAHQRR